MAGTPPRLMLAHTASDLAILLGVPTALITRRAFMQNQHVLYTQTTQRKRSGGTRIINAPRWPLANIQRRLLVLLEELYRPSSRVMGFVKERGIRKNALFHVGKRLIFNVDVKDYFGSIHIGRIRRRLMARPYSLSDDVATTIAKLCTLNDVLPTGAPTSPILANIVTSALDGALAAYGRQNGCFYTRYADDITFSTNRRSFPPGMVRRTDEVLRLVEAGPDLQALLATHGFVLNPAKTRLMDGDMRKEVSGVTCNERLNVRRTFMREVRGALHAWRKYGLNAAQSEWAKRYNWRGAHSLERSLRGRIEHIIHIRGENDAATANLVSQFNALPDRCMRNVDYTYSQRGPLGIVDSTCLIECANDDELVWSQGTGFVIEGGAVVTNHHVVSYRPEGADHWSSARTFPEILVTFDNLPIPFRMKLVHSDASKDVAILRCEDPVWNPVFVRKQCQLNFVEPVVGMPVSVIGYPNHTDGGSVLVYPGSVTGRRTFEGQPYFAVSQPIVKGNSGGPVVDQFGQVIGIATRGMDAGDIANIAFNGCIPVHSIDRIILQES